MLYQNEEWLRQKYEKELLTSAEIAKIVNMQPRDICYFLRKFKIKTRGTKKPRAGIEKITKQICNKCGIDKSINEFHKRGDIKDGYFVICKSCRSKKSKQYSEKNKEKISKYNKKWYENNREKKLKKNKEWVEKNKEKYKKIRYEYRQKPEIKEKIRKVAKKWDKNHSEQKNERMRKYRNKVKNTISFRLKNMMSAAIYHSLKRNKKGHRWEKLVGYTVDKLREHIEMQFEPWMNWDNWGILNNNKNKWQIDHIRPISSFDITDEKCENFRKCWSLKNLRPLKASENIRKKDKILLECEIKKIEQKMNELTFQLEQLKNGKINTMESNNAKWNICKNRRAQTKNI